MFRISLFTTIAAAALLADLAAQGGTIPANLSTAGNSLQTSNWRGARRHQIVLDPRVVPNLPAQLQALVLRGDDGTLAAPGAQLDVSVTLSSLGVPLPGAIDPGSYVNNFGRDAAVVVSNLRIATPATAGATVRLPFAQPFAYQNGNPLLVQIEFVPVPTPGFDNPTWTLDAHNLPHTFWGTNGATTGTGCPAPGSWTVSGLPLGDQLVFRWGTVPMPERLLAFVLFGLSDQHFGALQLPFDLSLFGMPGCALQTSIDAAFPTTTALGGGFGWVLVSARLPRDPLLTGLDIFAQAVVFDPSANAPGLRWSELRRERLQSAPAPLLASHAFGSFAPQVPFDVPEVVTPNRTLVFDLQ